MEPHDLYGLPLEQFTAGRNALARELRAGGDRDQADAVSKLRKPSVAAWAVNQLVRTQQREVTALFEAGDALQDAQAKVLAKRGDAASLRRAVEGERAAVEQLTDTARGLLNSDGHELTPATLEQVSETLHAAALDQEARAQVRDGCLQRVLQHVGLGGSATTSPPSTGRRPSRESRRERLKAARAEETSARRELDAATRELRAAEQRHERAQAELRDAEETLAGARRLAADAEEQHRQAKQSLEES